MAIVASTTAGDIKGAEIDGVKVIEGVTYAAPQPANGEVPASEVYL